MEVDIIFAGGGASACVAAGRLAAANPGLEIALIEQGPNNLNDPSVTTPALFLSHMAPTSKTATFWRGNKSDGLNGRSPTVPTGQVLGGGSSINHMMYARGSASDYDDWNTPGWTASELLPLLRKTYHLAAGRETHGYDGPVHVSYGDHYATVAKEYLDVAAKQGIPLVEDKMDLNTGHGSQRWAKWIDPETGRRQDAAHCFIHPLEDNKSLHVITKTKVSRVLFDGTTATGVEIVANKEQDETADQTPRIISARKLVTVSAGAIGTPGILQRSGIGAGDRLAKVGVETLVDLPGVGATYEDHTLVLYPSYVPDDMETYDPLLNQDPATMEGLVKQYAFGKGMLASNLIDAGAKLRPNYEERQKMGNDFDELWKNYFESKPDKPVVFQAIAHCFPGPRHMIPRTARMMTLGNCGTYPTSRGYVHITSSDPYAPPDFDPKLFDKSVDIDVHVWAYKKGREIVRRMPSFRGEFAPMHPKFSNEGVAAIPKFKSQLDVSKIKDIVYTEEDNTAIKAHIRQFGETTWHSCATVPMKSREKGGCVDPRLNVYGTERLKVVDLSIMPGNVGANTYSTALLVGEKAAILISEDLGLNSSLTYFSRQGIGLCQPDTTPR
ncbi:GMC oxidoreductase [Ceratobasidium sp. AG-Ba]|nr:GMC oxidoreductase [Ceratobasidium sp. AG-Ba]